MIEFSLHHQLPKKIGLIPLHGIVLMPRAVLPVPLLDPSHLLLVSSVLQTHKLLGIIQANIEEEEDFLETDTQEPTLYKAGTLAKIVDVSELDDKKLIVSLKGLCRFDIEEMLPHRKGYMRAKVNYDGYHVDLVEGNDFIIDRGRLMRVLKTYFNCMEIDANWSEIEKTSNEKLVTALTMLCPLEPREKQAVLQQTTLKQQYDLMTSLLEMASHDPYNPMTCH